MSAFNKNISMNQIWEQIGKKFAKDLQQNASNMTGTELYDEEIFIPSFEKAKEIKNMLERPIGFICISSQGHIVKLLQQYDSSIFTAEPEELPAQWGFYWSKDPSKARPFIKLSTSPYQMDDCCIFNNKIYKSLLDNNVWSPEELTSAWEEVII